MTQKYMKRCLFCLFLCISHLICLAEPSDSVASPTKSKGSLISRVVDYFRTSNVPRQDGKFDISFLGGPHYSSDNGFGIGLVAAGVYGLPKIDSVTGGYIQNRVSLYADVTTTGNIVVGIDGMQTFDDDTRRLNYNVFFRHHPVRFWGIGYEAARQNDNYTKYTRLGVTASAEFLFRFGGNFFIGPTIDFGWSGARKVKEPERWDGQPLAVASFGPGVNLSYDSRDNTTAPQRGIFAVFTAKTFPRFLGNRRGAFSITEIAFNGYQPLWKDGILAMRVHGSFTYGNTPWTMLPTFGGSYGMRGYYEGQYSDRKEADIVAELRQKVWKRSGFVVWAGAGTIFPKFEAFKWNRVLPNGGVGYRWEFKKNSNVRLDLGFGKGQIGFIFNINEAF